MKHKLLHALLFLAASLGNAFAQADAGKNVGDILKETEKVDISANDVSIIMWIPFEYWELSLVNNPRITDSQKEDILKMMRDYTAVLVVDAKKGGSDIFTFTSIENISKNSTLTLPSGQKLTPLSEDDLAPDTAMLMAMLKPIFKSTLGKMGENAAFLLFSNKDKDGKKLLDSRSTGKLVLKEKEHTASWRLPLGSLLSPKTCPTCGETLPGNYDFCPYDGTKLKEVPVKPSS